MSLLLLFTGAGTPTPYAAAIQQADWSESAPTQGISWFAPDADAQSFSTLPDQFSNFAATQQLWYIYAQTLTGSGAVSWNYYRGPVGGPWPFYVNAGATYEDHNVVDDGRFYEYRVAGVNAIGQEGPISPRSNTSIRIGGGFFDWTDPQDTVPTQGLNLAPLWPAVETSGELVLDTLPGSIGSIGGPFVNPWSLGLSWGAATNATSYNIYRAVGGSRGPFIANVAGTSFTDHNVITGTSYAYFIAGVNGFGEGPLGGPSAASSPTPAGGFLDWWDNQQDQSTAQQWFAPDAEVQKNERLLTTVSGVSTSQAAGGFIITAWTDPVGLTGSDSVSVFYAYDSPTALTGPGGPDSWAWNQTGSQPPGAQSNVIPYSGALRNHAVLYIRVVPKMVNGGAGEWGAPSDLFAWPIQHVSFIQQDDWSESRDQTVVWYQPDTGSEHVESRMSTAPTGATISWNSTTLFTNVNWTPPPGLIASDSQAVFFATDPNGLSGPGGPDSWTYFNAVSTGFTGSGVGTLDLNHSPIYARVVPWLNNNEWGAPSPVLGPVFPVSPALQTQPDWSESRDQTVVWYQPDTGAEFVGPRVVFNPANGFPDWFQWDVQQDQPNAQTWPTVETGGEHIDLRLGGIPTNVVVTFNQPVGDVTVTWTDPTGLDLSTADLVEIYFGALPTDLTGPGGPQGAISDRWNRFARLTTSPGTQTVTNPYVGAVANGPMGFAPQFYVRVVGEYDNNGIGIGGRLTSGAPSVQVGPFVQAHSAWLTQPDPSEQVPTQGLNLAPLWPAVETGGEHVDLGLSGQPTNVAVAINQPVGNATVTWTDPPGPLGSATQVYVFFGLTPASLSGPGGPDGWTPFYFQFVNAGVQNLVFSYTLGGRRSSYYVRVVAYVGIDTSDFTIVAGAPSDLAGPFIEAHSAWLTQPDPSEQVDQTVRWYDADADALAWCPSPPFQPSTATVAQQAGLLQQPDWSEQADQTVRWYQPEDDEFGLLPYYPPAEWFHVGGATNSGLATGSLVLTYSSTAGNLLVVSSSKFGLETVTGITDSAGNTWVKATSGVRGTVLTGELWYTPQPAAAVTSVTVTYSGAVGNAAAIVREFDGNGTWVLEGTAQANGASVPPSPSGPTGQVTQRDLVYGATAYQSAPAANASIIPTGAFRFGSNVGTSATSNASVVDDYLTNLPHFGTTEEKEQIGTGSRSWVAMVAAFKLVPFDPSYQTDGLDEQVDRTQQWFSPDAADFVFTPAAAPFNPATGFDWSEQPGQERDLSVTWFAPDEQAWVPIPGLTVASTAQQAAANQQPDASEAVDRSVVWYQPEDAWESPLPEVFEPPVVPRDLGGVYGQPDWSEQSDPADDRLADRYVWFQAVGIDTQAEWVPIPGLPSVPSAAQLAGLFGYDAQTDRDLTVVWFAPEEVFWTPIPGEPSEPTSWAWSQNPSDDEQVDRTQTWFAPEEQSWTPIPNLTQATAAQDVGLWQDGSGQQDASLAVTWYQPEDAYEGLTPPVAFNAAVYAGLWGWDAQQDRDQTVTWYQPEDAWEDPLPHVFTPPVVPNDLGGVYGQPDASEQLDRTVTWFQPDAELAWTPIPGEPSEPTLFAWLDADSPDEQVDRTQAWFQDETLAWVAIPNLTQATVAQEAGANQQPDWSESDDQTVWWYQPDADLAAWTPLPGEPSEPTNWAWQQNPDDSETIDQSVRWYQTDTEVWTPIPNAGNAPTTFAWAQNPDDSETIDQSVRWYQPEDDWFGVPPFQPSTATVPQQIAANQQPDWSEQYDRTVTWFAPDAEAPYLTPPFQPSTATVAQDAGLWIDGSGQQDQSLAVTWYQPEDQWFSTLVNFVTVATVPQQAPLWIEQPGQERSLDVVWFAPDAEVEGFRPLVSAPTTPDFGWTDVQDTVDQTVRWFAPDASVEGLVPLGPEPTTPDFGYDAQQDRDQTVVWYQPDTGAEWVPIPNLSQATVAQQAGLFGYDPQTDLDLTVRWFAPDEIFWTPIPGEPSEPTLFAWQQNPDQSEERDQTVTWFQDETIAWTPVPGEPSEPTTFAWAQQPDASESIDQTVLWFQDEHLAWVPIPNEPSEPTTFGWEQVADENEQLDRSVLWFQDEHLAWVPIPNLTVATTAQQAGLWQEQTEQLDLTVRTYQPEDAYEGLTPPVAAFNPATAGGLWIDLSGQQDRDLTQQWFSPDELFWSPTPFAVPIPVALYPIQTDGLDEQVSRDVTWFQDEHSAFVSPSAPGSEPTAFAWLQQPDPSEQLDQTVTWFQDEHSAWVPLQNPSTASAAQQAGLWIEQPGQERDQVVTWFRPDDPTDDPYPRPSPAIFAGAEQQPDPSEQVARDVRWYQPEDAYENPLPAAYRPFDPRTTGTLYQPDWSEVRDQTVRTYQPEDLSVFATQITLLGRVRASDAAASLVVASDSDSLVVGTDSASNIVSATDHAAGIVTGTDAAANLVVGTDSN